VSLHVRECVCLCLCVHVCVCVCAQVWRTFEAVHVHILRNACQRSKIFKTFVLLGGYAAAVAVCEVQAEASSRCGVAQAVAAVA
jgi:hypothetical protein